MDWLGYSMDEVASFHPAFYREAHAVLEELGLHDEYQWDHHPTDSIAGVPDFVLRHSSTGRWILVVEIKRTPQAVWSPHFQAQAKGYAEANRARFRQGWPAYFAITNLELFVLGALNGERPPRECLIQGGTKETARLGLLNEGSHRAAIRNVLAAFVKQTVQERSPRFDQVWPGVIDLWLARADSFPVSQGILIHEPNSPGWSHVQGYFADDRHRSSKRIFLFRCLAIEYIRGTLQRHGHPRANSVPPLRRGSQRIVASLMALQEIDFDAVLERDAPAMYRGLNESEAQRILDEYIGEISEGSYRVAHSASNRADAPLLMNSLFASITPPGHQDSTGKVQTDPELATVLSWLSIDHPSAAVVDLGCGDGALLLAAYDKLVSLGANPEEVLPQLSGVEADPISIRIAGMRLALKEPKLADPTKQATLIHGDVFAHPTLITTADVVLMNPPFQRYEARHDNGLLHDLREHYAEQIRSAGGTALSAQGQSNLYSFYVEFTTECMKEGAVLGLVLDNKWYHNRYATQLRRLILDKFEILALVEYPHSAFFRDWMVSTSLLVARRRAAPSTQHVTRFIRSRVDPRGTDLEVIAEALAGRTPWPYDWSERLVPQGELNAQEGWKRHFATPLKHDFLSRGMPTLGSLFLRSRRGSLNKEGGGLQILEFPFGRTNYGPRRIASETGGRYATSQDRILTAQENSVLRELADNIPEDFRGYSVKNSDRLSGFVLSVSDVTRDQTLEPPTLRAQPDLFRQARRAPWSEAHDLAIRTMADEPGVGSYIEAVDNLVNLSDAIPDEEVRWVGLREPHAGELIIPRKFRGGHRVHLNPFALDPDGRQVRLSSNFISFGGFRTVDSAGLDTRTALELVASFLLSAFGQLQFEASGYNREGMLAIEKSHLINIAVFDPRWVSPSDYDAIVAAYRDLPYPIPPQPSATLPERAKLDRLWAMQLAQRYDFAEGELLEEVHDLLDEFIVAREP